MDCFCVKRKNYKQCEKQLRGLSGKVRLLQEEIKVIMCEREKESRNFERDLMIFAFKEAEWKQEKKKLKEEVKRLRKMMEDKEDKVIGIGEKNENNSSMEERLWRDEAVEKWKNLYLAIKTELDDLIQRTHRDGLYWKAEEEEMIEELKMEVKAKEETIEELKGRLAIAERQEYMRAREVDILRQSLRIMSSKKAPTSFPLTKPNFPFVKQANRA